MLLGCPMLLQCLILCTHFPSLSGLCLSTVWDFMMMGPVMDLFKINCFGYSELSIWKLLSLVLEIFHILLLVIFFCFLSGTPLNQMMNISDWSFHFLTLSLPFFFPILGEIFLNFSCNSSGEFIPFVFSIFQESLISEYFCYSLLCS